MQSGTIFCTTCGVSNISTAAFCFSCGQKVQIGTRLASPLKFSGTATGRLPSSHLLNQRYLIGPPLGLGGMGAVYKAADTQFGNRAVAIKEMSQGKLDPQEALAAVEQFKQEAHLLAGLKHPSLPSIYDHFSEAGRWYLVMDFIEGTTLETYIEQYPGKVVPLKDALDIGIQLTKVLGYLHTRATPIIFRDLKPLNIMRTPDGHIYLVDFGIARLFKPGQVKDTAVYISPGYASPEQFGTTQTTSQSDIYSLGATLHRLFTGHLPQKNIPIFQFQPLRLYNPTLPLALEELIAHMVSMHENQRPASMAIVRQELEHIKTQLDRALLQSQLPPNPVRLPTIPVPQPQNYAHSMLQSNYIQSQQLQQQSAPKKSLLPKYGFLKSLPIVVIIGIFAIVMGYNTSIPSSLLFLSTSLLIPIATGFIVGKVAVLRRIGFFAGIIYGMFAIAVIVIIASQESNTTNTASSTNANGFLTGLILVLLILVFYGFLALFGAFIATRKHPHYKK